MNDLSFLLDVQFIIKIIILFAIFLYVIFTLNALVQVRALNKLIVIESGKSSNLVQFLFLLYFISVISLFVFAIVIL